MTTVKVFIFSLLYYFVSADPSSAPKYVQIFGNCDESTYIGNKILFAQCHPIKSNRQTIIFPQVRSSEKFYLVNLIEN